MQHRRRLNSMVTSLVLGLLLGTPVIAHKIKVAEDIAVTIHIEPDDRPRAGEPAQAWFVLTQAGGGVVPLAACHCQLAVYQEGQATGPPVLQPPLKAVSAEQYEDIPGAAIVFPELGVYELELQGTPKTEDRFQPFRVRFPVTVAKGKSVPKAAPASLAPIAEQLPSSPGLWWQIGIGVAVAIGLGGVGLGVRWWKAR